MKVLLAGPMATEGFRSALGQIASDAPAGIIQTPIGPLGLELLKRGHHVSVLTLDHNLKKREVIESGALRLIFLPVRSRPRERFLDFFAQEIRALKSEINSSHVDVVHAHWAYEYAAAAISSGVPTVVTMHDAPIQVALQFRNVYRSARALLALRTLSKARHLTIVSEDMRRWVRLHGYRGRIQVIPNGVDLSGSLRSFRPAGVPKVVTIGDISVRKNIPGALEAFAHIVRVIPEAELHLFGPGLDPAFVGERPNVFGHGSTDHSTLMRFLEAEAAVLMHSSFHETFGVIVAEALARGVPAIAGRDAGGVAQLIGEDLSELLVDVRSPEAMAAGVLRVLEDGAAYERAATLGRARVEAMFSAQSMATSFERLYETALAERKK